jgi:biofilm PGA synthesis protein PgaA
MDSTEKIQNSIATQGDIELILERVRGLVDEGNYNKALVLLSPYISEPLRYPRATSDYIVILVWAGRGDEAIRMFESLPPSFPRRAYLLRNVAKAYFDRREFTKAFLLYQSVIEKTPSDIEAQKGLVMSLIEAGELEDALEYLNRFHVKDDVEFELMKAYLLFKKGDYLDSLQLYQRIKETEEVNEEEIDRKIDDLIASLSQGRRADLLSQLTKSAALEDYIVALVIYKDYEKAIQVFEERKPFLQKSDYLLSWIGWAYFKEGDVEKAKEYYNLILQRNPEYTRAKIGLAYCLAEEIRSTEALSILNKLPQKDLRVSFARAYVFEKAKKFWEAIKEYDRILEIYPQNRVAQRLRLIALSDLGATSPALEKAYQKLPDEKDLHISLIGDLAVDRIKWEEPRDAKKILQPLLKDSSNLRARFDYIVALAENDEMKEVVDAYEELVDRDISPPWWVLENVAKAYLYLEKPKKALELYNKALKSNPRSYNGRLGKFYTLQELRKFNEARKILNELDREQPEVYWLGRSPIPNWKKLELAVIKGWMLAYEDRLKEAEKYFWQLREQAPANMGIRTGLAHIYLWRGWPRKALREFKIIHSLEPHNVKARIGMMYTLNQLAYKEEARQGAQQLIEKYPKDKHVQQLVRRFEVEEMREIRGDFVYFKDEDGYEDIRVEITLYQPITLYTRAYGFSLWQQSYVDTEKKYYYYRRVGVGVEHIFNSSWWARQHFSADYDTGEDFGSYTEVVYTPDDYWRFGLSYDSFTTDLPVRARVYNVEASKLEADITYRESEWREYGLLLSFLNFSDGNDRLQGMFTYEQGLYVKNNWRFRFFLELYSSKNSKKDVLYFNPEYDLSLSATLMTEYTHCRIYNKAFLQKLFLTVGTYKQSGFSPKPTWAVRYEHIYDFSDTQALLWGITVSRQVYDGEPVHNYTFYLTYRGRF